MSRQEQAALVAFVNGFELSKRVASFDQLGDAKLLTELMAQIDVEHFRASATVKGFAAPTASSSSDNPVIRANALKRFYHRLLSYNLAPPHPATLASTTFPEPAFSFIVKDPQSPEGSAGLLQICRCCLAAAVWGPSNEQVIAKIQALPERQMAELMRSIETVTQSLPARQTVVDRSPEASSPVVESEAATLLLGLRSQRDNLLEENSTLKHCLTELEDRFEVLNTEVTERKLDQRINDEASREIERTRVSTQAQAHDHDLERVRRDLSVISSQLQSELERDNQARMVSELHRTIEELQAETAEIASLRDQLEVQRHATDRVQRSEEIIERYKKRLEEMLPLRRDIKILELENENLTQANKDLQEALRRTETVRDAFQPANHQNGSDENDQLSETKNELFHSRQKLAELQSQYRETLEDLHLHQDRIQELEMRSVGEIAGDHSLGDEMGGETDSLSDVRGTKTELRLRIRALEREVASLQIQSSDLPSRDDASSHDSRQDSKDARALRKELIALKESFAGREKRFELEQKTMLSAWHALGMQIAGEHVLTASTAAFADGKSPSKPPSTSWLGRQRQQQDDAKAG